MLKNDKLILNPSAKIFYVKKLKVFILILNVKPTECTKLFLMYLQYNVMLSIAVCFDLQRTIISEPNQSSTA